MKFRIKFSRIAFVCISLTYTISVFSQTNEIIEPHPVSRVGAGIGNSTFGNFLEFQLRPYSHDLLNSNVGYVPYSESGKFNASFRYYQNTNRFEISKFSIVKLMSLSPFNGITESKSYGLDIGLESVTVSEKNKYFDQNKSERRRISPISGDLLGGYTFEKMIGSDRSPLILSVLGGIKTQIHPQFNEFVRLGPQAVIMLLYDLGILKFQLNSSYQYYTFFRNQNDYSNSLKIRYSIDRQQEIRLEIARMRFDQEFILSYIYMF